MKVGRNLFDILSFALCLALAVGTGVYLLLAWDSLPAELPSHFGFSGKIDSLGAKGGLLPLYGLAWVLLIGLTALAQFPRAWNTGVAVTPENSYRVYRTLKTMLGTTRLIIVVMFCFLTVWSTLNRPLPVLFLPVFLAAVFGSIVVFSVRLNKMK